MRATHIPRRPKKKPLRGKKVGSAEKKTAPDAKKWRIVCVKGGIFLPMILATTDPLEALHSGYAISKLRFRLRLSLAWSFSQYAIGDGGISGYRGLLYKFFVGEMFLCLRWGKKIRRGATFDVFVLWRKRMGRLRFLVCGEAMLNFYF